MVKSHVPSKQKSSVVNVVKVNIAVAKITMKAEYDKHLPETKKQIGNCPTCNQMAHT